MGSRKRWIHAAIMLSLLIALWFTRNADTAPHDTPKPTESPVTEVSISPTPTITSNAPTVTTEPPIQIQIRGAGNVSDVRVDPDKYYYNADELATGLLYELVPLAPYFVEAQEKYGIDAVFLAAVAAEESGWGRYLFRRNNIFGFENCDFDSLPECIDYAADWIKTEYLTPGGLYYNGESVTNINTRYNGRATWEEHVIEIMGQIVARIERTDNQ